MYELVKCSACGVEKRRKFLKNMPRGEWVRPVYVDGTGRQWMYKKCPDCRYNVVAKPVKSKRLCLYCKEGLSVNYFYHDFCLAMKENQVGYTPDHGSLDEAVGKSKAWL